MKKILVIMPLYNQEKYVQMANDDKVRYANEKSAAPITE